MYRSLLCLALMMGCADTQMGIDGEPVNVSLDGVSWVLSGEGLMLGVLRLQHNRIDQDRWLVNMNISRSILEDRVLRDINQLPPSNRIFLTDLHGDDVTARLGDLTVGPRGGGRIDAVFGGGPNEETYGVSVDWTHWQVDDKRDIERARGDSDGSVQ
ncbi:MAG: hypothetical protein AB8H79_18095 [Myxococcota bacterium]